VGLGIAMAILLLTCLDSSIAFISSCSFNQFPFITIIYQTLITTFNSFFRSLFISRTMPKGGGGRKRQLVSVVKEITHHSDSDSDDGITERRFPGKAAPHPDGAMPLCTQELAVYRRDSRWKSIQKDLAMTQACLVEVARRFFYTDYAIMTGEGGPMAPSFRAEPPSMEDLKQWLFAEILREQGILGIDRRGNLLCPSLTLSAIAITSNHLH
jgi:hypothetical protein